MPSEEAVCTRQRTEKNPGHLAKILLHETVRSSVRPLTFKRAALRPRVSPSDEPKGRLTPYDIVKYLVSS